MIVAVIAQTEPCWTAETAHFLCAGGGSLAMFAGDSVASSLDRRIHRLIAGFADTYGHHGSRPTRRLLDALSRIVPDVVHIVDLVTDFYNYPMLLDGLSRMPVEIAVSTAWRSPGGALLRRPGYNSRIIARMTASMPRVTMVDPVATAGEAVALYRKLTAYA